MNIYLLSIFSLLRKNFFVRQVENLILSRVNKFSDMNWIWFLIIIGIFWIFLYLISKQFGLSKYGIIVAPFILIIKTTKLNKAIEKISLKYQKEFTLLFKIGTYLYYILLIISLTGLSINIIHHFFFSKSESVGLVPLIPGITLSLKRFVYFIFPLSIALLAHEIAHGIAAINEKISVKGIGIFIFLIMLIAAFVELDQGELEKSDKNSRKRVYAAGITANILLATLFVPLIGVNNIFTSQFYEQGDGILVVGVRTDSPAEKAGIKEGIVIIGILITKNNSYIQTPTVEKLVFVMNSLENGEIIIILTLEQQNYTLVTPPSTPVKNSIDGGRFGLLLFQYMKPKYSFLSPKLPYIIQEEIFLTINLNLVLALINVLPIIVFDGGKFLYLVAEGSPNRKKLFNLLQLLSLVLIVLNVFISF